MVVVTDFLDSFVPPAGVMKFLLDFFTKKSRGAGAEPRRSPRRRGVQGQSPAARRVGAERRSGSSALNAAAAVAHKELVRQDARFDVLHMFQL